MSYFTCKRVEGITLAHPKIQIIPSFTPFLGVWLNCGIIVVFLSQQFL